MAAMYAVYHGPSGLRDIAVRVHQTTLALAEGGNHSNTVVSINVVMVIM